jgi:hypothetical protein
MRLPAVVVMKTTQYGARDELPNHLWLGPWHLLAWDSLSNTLVGPGVVEAPLILFHCPVQMPLAQEQDVLQALPPHSAQEPLTRRCAAVRDSLRNLVVQM